METASFSLLELFKLGGVVMWPLLVFSIVAVAITIERAVFFIQYNFEVDDLSAAVSDYIKKDDLSGAALYLEPLKEKRMGARVLFTLVSQKDECAFNEQRAERVVQTEAISCINSMENGFNFLTVLGSLSPLTGFLGTVTGMIGAFRSIAEATEVNAQIVANGIYEALTTTVFGLVIAIIAMISHSVFSNFVEKFASKIEGECSSLISKIAEMSPAVNTAKHSVKSSDKK
jgi:biopolymer transport protein ExbB